MLILVSEFIDRKKKAGAAEVFGTTEENWNSNKANGGWLVYWNQFVESDFPWLLSCAWTSCRVLPQECYVYFERTNPGGFSCATKQHFRIQTCRDSSGHQVLVGFPEQGLNLKKKNKACLVSVSHLCWCILLCHEVKVLLSAYLIVPRWNELYHSGNRIEPLVGGSVAMAMSSK